MMKENAANPERFPKKQPLTELRDGRYIVVLNVVYSSYASENEYKRGEDEYAFSLTVDADGDPSLTAAPALP